MFDLTGRQLGKYQINERLGRGGMATVYRAYQPGIDRFVAVKVIHLQFADDPTFVERFRREARAVGTLRHPNIVQVIDFDLQDGIYYMVMEYLQGETLKARLQRMGAMPIPEALMITRKLADAVSYAHSEGMLHRDIKPANVIFAKNGEPILTDFGIAKLADSTGLTASGSATGTPAYMSPESGRGDKVDERSDVYSLGVVLYEMLTGVLPFDADTPFAVIQKHNYEPLPSPRMRRPDLTDGVEAVLFKSLAKSPVERYISAADFRDALDAMRATQPAQPTSALKVEPPPTRIAPASGDDHTVMPTRQVPQGATPPQPPNRAGLPLGPILGIVAVVALVVVGVVLLTGNRPAAPLATLTPTPAAAVVVEVTAEAPPPTPVPATATALPPTVVASAPTATAIPPTATTVPDRATLPPEETALPTVPTLPPTPFISGEIAQLQAQITQLTRDGNYDVALETVTAALAKDPDSYDLRALKAVVLVLYRSDAAKLEEGRQISEALIKAAPERSEGYFTLGYYHQYSPNDNPERANELYTQAVERGSTNLYVYYNRAIARIYLSRPREEILADLDTAIRLAPQEPESYRLRATYNYDNGFYPEAEADFLTYNQIAPSIGNHETLGRTYLKRGKKQEAYDLYNQTISETRTNNPEYLAQGAFIAWEVGRTAEGLAWADRALTIDPETLAAQYIMALFEQGQKKFDSALQRLDNIAKSNEAWRYEFPYLNPDFGRSLNYDRGNILLEMGRLDDAEKAYALAVEQHGFWAESYLAQARVLIQLGRVEDARAVLRLALELDSVRADTTLEQKVLDLLRQANPTATPSN